MSDGCTAGPLSDWLNSLIYTCCVQHDEAYAKVQTVWDKLVADGGLVWCGLTGGHAVAAIVAGVGVTIGGWFFIKWGRNGSR